MLLFGCQLPEHSLDLVPGGGVELAEGFLPFIGQREEHLSPVFVGTSPADQPALLETAEDPAQVPGIQVELSSEMGSRRPFVVGEFVDHPCLGEGERAFQESLLEDSDLLGVEAVEPSNGFDSRSQTGVGSSFHSS